MIVIILSDNIIFFSRFHKQSFESFSTKRRITLFHESTLRSRILARIGANYLINSREEDPSNSVIRYSFPSFNQAN